MPKLAVFPKGFFADLTEGRMSLFEWLDLASQLEVDGAELYPGFFQSFDPDYVKRVKHALARCGLQMPMMCHSPDFTQPDPQARRQEVLRTEQMITLTAELGGSFCRVLSGQGRPNLDAKAAFSWVIECLEALLPHAEKSGVVLTIENHYKDGTWLYPEFAQAHTRYLSILNAFDSPWLKAQYDPSNAVIAGEDPYELLDQVVGRVVTVHASDRYLEGGTIEDLRSLERDPQHGYARILKHGVIGRGLNDFDRIFSTLAKAGFSGWVSIEDGEGPSIAEGMRNLHESATFLRRKLAQHFRTPLEAGNS